MIAFCTYSRLEDAGLPARPTTGCAWVISCPYGTVTVAWISVHVFAAITAGWVTVVTVEPPLVCRPNPMVTWFQASGEYTHAVIT
jgi:flavin reductase (DIM6/NTAB) family NADH-FMN oxidoreductase RutF